MAKAIFVKAARKDYPEHGIKKGESYYHWQLFKQPKRFSKTLPRASQLTGSNFLSQLYSFQEELEDMTAMDIDDLQNQMEDLAGRIRELGEEQRSNRENMPEGLQDSDTGQLLEERADEMEGWADSIEGMDFSFDPKDVSVEEEATEEEKEQAIADALQERINELISEATDSAPCL